MPTSGLSELHVEIVTIGREILDGRVIDTNAVRIAEELRAIGLVARFAQKVDDDLERIVDAFRIASERARIVLVTGGLGPTSDDLTAQAFAKFMGEPLRFDEAAHARIAEYFKRAGREMLEVQKKQAYLPRSCFTLDNDWGTAPGFGLATGEPESGIEWYFMPGVPHEMSHMLHERIVPRILQRHPALRAARSMTWATQFVAEGELQTRLAPIEKRLPAGFELTYRTRFPENHIGLYAGGGETAVFDGFCGEITAALGAETFTTTQGDQPLKTLEAVVIEKLAAAGATLSTIESCTGGLVAHRLTNVSGASSQFWGGTVAYDNAAKEALGVPKALLVEHGAVSPEVARAMAEAGLRQLQAHPGITARGRALCVATTGIAGPGGGTDAKPVGLCYIALAREGGETIVEEIRGRKVWSRDYMKTFFAQKALSLVLGARG